MKRDVFSVEFILSFEKNSENIKINIQILIKHYVKKFN